MSNVVALTSKIKLNHGQFTVVDAKDSDLAEMRWYAKLDNKYGGDGAFTARRNVWIGNGKYRTELLHRVIMARVLGRELTRHECVDHISGCTLDNRRENLRVATHAENCRNRGIRSNNNSGYKGVNYYKRYERWVARIQVDGKRRHIGYFDTAEEAARAYDKAARDLHGEYARTNFVLDGFKESELVDASDGQMQLFGGGAA